jgi:hypothetical protein
MADIFNRNIEPIGRPVPDDESEDEELVEPGVTVHQDFEAAPQALNTLEPGMILSRFEVNDSDQTLLPGTPVFIDSLNGVTPDADGNVNVEDAAPLGVVMESTPHSTPLPEFLRRFAAMPDHSIEVPPPTPTNPDAVPPDDFIQMPPLPEGRPVRFFQTDEIAVALDENLGRMTVSAGSGDIQPGTVFDAGGEQVTINAFIPAGSQMELPYSGPLRIPDEDEAEPDATSIPYIQGNRYAVTFDRVVGDADEEAVNQMSQELDRETLEAITAQLASTTRLNVQHMNMGGQQFPVLMQPRPETVDERRERIATIQQLAASGALPAEAARSLISEAQQPQQPNANGDSFGPSPLAGVVGAAGVAGVLGGIGLGGLTGSELARQARRQQQSQTAAQQAMINRNAEVNMQRLAGLGQVSRQTAESQMGVDFATEARRMREEQERLQEFTNQMLGTPFTADEDEREARNSEFQRLDARRRARDRAAQQDLERTQRENQQAQQRRNADQRAMLEAMQQTMPGARPARPAHPANKAKTKDVPVPMAKAKKKRRRVIRKVEDDKPDAIVAFSPQKLVADLLTRLRDTPGIIVEFDKKIDGYHITTKKTPASGHRRDAEMVMQARLTDGEIYDFVNGIGLSPDEILDRLTKMFTEGV